VEVAVVADAEALQRRAHLLEHELDALAGELLGGPVRGVRDARGEVGDVVAVVAVLRRLLPAGTGADRLAEAPDLAAGVVDVVLALDGVAGELEHPRERVAVGGVAARGDGDRPRRVRRHELHEDPLGRLGDAGAVRVAGVEDVGERVAHPGVGHEEVEEARTRDVDAGDLPGELLGDERAEALGDRARRLPERGREQHRGVGGVVAELGLRRALELGQLRQRAAAQLGGGVGEGGTQRGDGVGHGGQGG